MAASGFLQRILPFYPYTSDSKLKARAQQASFSRLESFQSVQSEPWSLIPNPRSIFFSWYEREIVGSDGYGMHDFKTQCGHTIDKVVHIMQQQMPLNVKEVVKVNIRYPLIRRIFKSVE